MSIVGMESAVRLAKALPQPHNIPISAGLIIDMADEITRLQEEVSNLTLELALTTSANEANIREANKYREDSERLAFVYSDEKYASDDLLHIEFNIIQGKYPTIDEVRIAIDNARGKDNESNN